MARALVMLCLVAGCTMEGRYLVDAAAYEEVTKPLPPVRRTGEGTRSIGETVLTIYAVRGGASGVIVDVGGNPCGFEVDSTPALLAGAAPGSQEALDRLAAEAVRKFRLDHVALRGRRATDGKKVDVRLLELDLAGAEPRGSQILVSARRRNEFAWIGWPIAATGAIVGGFFVAALSSGSNDALAITTGGISAVLMLAGALITGLGAASHPFEIESNRRDTLYLPR
jgi:hypothetical protein